MINADRKYRSQRTVALACGVLAEVALGAALLGWAISAPAPDRLLFGPVGSIAVVVAAMVLLAVVLVFLVVGPRFDRKVLLTAASVVSLVSAGVGVLAVTTLFTEPGIGLLLGFGWVLTMPVTLPITRGGVPPNREP